MRLVQSQAAVALRRPGRLQRGGGIKKLAFALSMACLFAPASARAQHAYITNDRDNGSVIDTATNAVVSSMPVSGSLIGVAVTFDGSKVYVTNSRSNTVSVIDTATNTVVSSITVGDPPCTTGCRGAYGVAVTRD